MRVELMSHSGGKNVMESVAYYARVSNPTSQANALNSEKLIHYLIENKHWSPFEMVSFTLEVETTRDIARQMLRHRSFSFQEMSTRYSSVAGVYETPFEYREARIQDQRNRQNSFDCSDPELSARWDFYQAMVMGSAQEAYSWALENGIAKEQARAVLPEGMTKSRLYVAGTLRSWIHYIQVRTEKGTQKEHRELAKECAIVISSVFPMIMDFVEKE